MNHHRQKRILQNARRTTDLQKNRWKYALDFSIFAPGIRVDLLKFIDNFTPFFFFKYEKPFLSPWAKILENLRRGFVAMYMMNKCAKFHNYCWNLFFSQLNDAIYMQIKEMVSAVMGK